MESPWILLGLALFPVVVLCFFIYKKDRYSKEPFSMLLKALFVGALSVLPTVFVENYLSGYNHYEGATSALFNAFVVAGCTEEFFKLFFLFWLVWRSRYFDEYFDGIVYAVFVSLGFALVENILYVFSAGFYTGVGRAIFSVPGHFLFAIVMGYFFAIARFSRKKFKKIRNLILAFVAPVLLHGTFDGILMISDVSEGLQGICVIAFIFFDIKLWKLGQRKMRELEGR